MSQRGDQQVWMLNYLEFNDQANYGADPNEVASGHSITGEAAYSRYGQGMIGSLAAVRARLNSRGEIEFGTTHSHHSV